VPAKIQALPGPVTARAARFSFPVIPTFSAGISVIFRRTGLNFLATRQPGRARSALQIFNPNWSFKAEKMHRLAGGGD
jgi:hypothetical protein